MGARRLPGGQDVYDPHIVYIPPANNPATGRYVGIEDFGQMTRDWLKAWANIPCTAEEFIEAENSVVVASRWRAEGRGSGAETDPGISRYGRSVGAGWSGWNSSKIELTPSRRWAWRSRR